jgi:ABC-type uncharacterized transport system auxiliary subunit
MTGKVFSCSIMYVLACLMIFSGCGSRRAYDKKYYVLDAVRRAEPIRTETDSILEVRRFTIDSAFGGKGLVYRTGDFAYESDFYSEFLVSPAAMITDKMRNWLSGAGLFGTVLDVGSQVDATHVIEGNITALYGDFRDKSSPKATMKMRVFLLKAEAGGEYVPLFAEKYQTSIGIESEGPEEMVRALDKCLADILSAIEKDLIERAG